MPLRESCLFCWTPGDPGAPQTAPYLCFLRGLKEKHHGSRVPGCHPYWAAVLMGHVSPGALAPPRHLPTPGPPAQLKGPA